MFWGVLSSNFRRTNQRIHRTRKLKCNVPAISNGNNCGNRNDRNKNGNSQLIAISVYLVKQQQQQQQQ